MRLFKILLAVMLLVVFAGVVALLTWPGRMNREIDSRIAAIKAKGDPVCGKDLIHKAVPDAENGAVLYERVFAMIKPSEKDIDKAYDVSSPYKLKGHPEYIDCARKLAAKYGSVLPLVEEAESRPRCRFNTNWNDPPEDLNFPWDKKLRKLSQFLSEIAIIDATDGRMDKTVRAIRLTYQLNDY